METNGPDKCESAEGESAWDAAARFGEDMALLEHLLTLTPMERLVRHERARLAVKALRQAGRKHYGFDPGDPEATE